MSVQTNLRTITKLTESELSKWPDAELIAVAPKDHVKITIRLGQRIGSIFTGSTPSDVRGQKNYVCSLRKKLRELSEQRIAA